MLPRELVRQVRRLHIRARRAVEDLLGGEYRSVFKGTGIAFEEVREYQPGDEVRSIDWNVTARMGHPFVKRYVEERQLTVLLLIDASASQSFSTQLQEKREVAAELAALLAFCAVGNHDRVGLVLFSDRVEKYVPPRKGVRHVLRLIRDILFFKPQGRGTSLRTALDFANQVLHRRAILFLFSDFMDRGYEKSFQRSARRHDLVAVAQADPREQALPPIGLLEVEDPETGQTLLIDTSNRALQEDFAAAGERRRQELRRLARAQRVDVLEVGTDGRHLDALVRFFHLRERRLHRT